jgi:hypothetical protein
VRRESLADLFDGALGADLRSQEAVQLLNAHEFHCHVGARGKQREQGTRGYERWMGLRRRPSERTLGPTSGEIQLAN